MCYNVLCDKYATRQMYGYCPSWALTWEYRKKVKIFYSARLGCVKIDFFRSQAILDEIRHYSADIISLQEVETDQFYNFFKPELKNDGYEGIFSPKSRAKTMSENDRKYVDGCAIFFRANKWVPMDEKFHFAALTDEIISQTDSHWWRNIWLSSTCWRWRTAKDLTTCWTAWCQRTTSGWPRFWRWRRTRGKVCRRSKRPSRSRSSSAPRTSIGIRSSAMSNSSRRWCWATSWRRSSTKPVTASVRATRSTSTTCSCCCAATSIHCPTRASSNFSATDACRWTIPTSRSSATSRACRRLPIVIRPMNLPIPLSSRPPTAKTSCPTPTSHSTLKVLSTTSSTRSRAWCRWACWDRCRRTGCARTKSSAVHILEYRAITFRCWSRWSSCTWQTTLKRPTDWSTADSRRNKEATCKPFLLSKCIVILTFSSNNKDDNNTMISRQTRHPPSQIVNLQNFLKKSFLPRKTHSQTPILNSSVYVKKLFPEIFVFFSFLKASF